MRSPERCVLAGGCYVVFGREVKPVRTPVKQEIRRSGANKIKRVLIL
jgi:hypothetical protein